MRAVVRSVMTPDSLPEDPDDAQVLMQVFVGPSDGPGEEMFSVLVTTGRALERELESHPFIVARHYLVVESFNWPRVEAYLRRRIESLSANSWHELALKVGRIGQWEFDDREDS